MKFDIQSALLTANAKYIKENDERIKRNKARQAKARLTATQAKALTSGTGVKFTKKK